MQQRSLLLFENSIKSESTRKTYNVKGKITFDWQKDDSFIVLDMFLRRRNLMACVYIRDNEMPEPNEGSKIISFENGIDTHHMLTMVEELKDHRDRVDWLAGYYAY